jgi:hypothetical protein
MTTEEFQTDMDTPCTGCLEPAKFHRLTPAGRFYCLKWNSSHTWRLNLKNVSYRIYTAKVNELRRSPLSIELGLRINSQIRGHVEPVEQLSL